MNQSQKQRQRSLVWKKFLFYLLLFLVLNLLVEGLLHFPFSDSPLLLKDLRLGSSFGFAFGLSFWGQSSFSIWQRVGLFFALILLSLLFFSVVIQGLFGFLMLSFWIWLVLLMTGVIIVYLYYHFVKPEL